MEAVQMRTLRAMSLAEAIALFGFDSLKPEQEILINASIAGKHVFGILPTSFGKSACYLIPGLVTGAKTIVISPLIALQEDQVRSLRKRGIQAYALHSGMDEVRKAAVRVFFKRSPKGEPAFLYISPEMFMSETFHQQFLKVRFDRLAIDEAHCVSTWGNSFRPEYLRIRAGAARNAIKHCSAFTATTDAKIERDILARLPLSEDVVRIEASPMRPNLLLHIESQKSGVRLKTESGRRKLDRLAQLLVMPEFKGATIVYCNSRHAAATLHETMRQSEFCRLNGYKSYLFHSQIGFDDKKDALTGFLEDEFPLVFATSAFGLGIDRGDVRQIVHYNVPFTLIDYAQQIGRGGRDGKLTRCTVFYSHTEFLQNEIDRISRDMPSIDYVERTLENIRKSIEFAGGRKRKFNLRAYTSRLRNHVEESEAIKAKEIYMQRFMTTLSILQQTNLITEHAGVITCEEAKQGSVKHDRLIEATKMHERMLAREKERLAEFFGNKSPTQELLWEIVRRP